MAGGSRPRDGGGPGGRRGVCEEGGGLKMFFLVPNSHLDDMVMNRPGYKYVKHIEFSTVMVKCCLPPPPGCQFESK